MNRYICPSVLRAGAEGKRKQATDARLKQEQASAGPIPCKPLAFRGLVRKLPGDDDLDCNVTWVGAPFSGIDAPGRRVNGCHGDGVEET